MVSDSIPLLKSDKPRKVPLGFSSPKNPVMIDQIKLAKDIDSESES